jgi:hypothetical protein
MSSHLQHILREVSARFSERQLSTEGGALLLRETDRKVGLLSRVKKCFSDHRHPRWIVHELSELLAQRITWLSGVRENDYLSGIVAMNDLLQQYPKDMPRYPVSRPLNRSSLLAA